MSEILTLFGTILIVWMAVLAVVWFAIPAFGRWLLRRSNSGAVVKEIER